MRKTIVMLAVVVGLAGLQMDAEARGGKGGGGKGLAAQGMEAGEMTNQQRQQKRLQLQNGSGAGTGAGDKTQRRQQVRDPDLHTPAPVEILAE